MGKTTIEWTATTRPDGRVSPGYTFNPWWGCSKVAEGCAHCYAEAFSKRTGRAQWGVGGTRVKMSESYWRQPLKWDRESKAAGERRRVFCASMADVFEDWPGRIVNSRGEVQWWRNDLGVVGAGGTTIDHSRGERLATMGDLRHDLFALIDSTPNLDWLVLTKRPENIRRMWPQRCDSKCECECHDVPEDRVAKPCAAGGCWYRTNAWRGTSISDQQTADRNVPLLLKSTGLSPVSFLSAEPLLGPIDFRWKPYHHQATGETYRAYLDRVGSVDEYESLLGINWVIIGSESGGGRRPMNPDWARSIRDQCQAVGVAFFMKQMEVSGKVTGDLEDFPPDLQIREFPTLEATR